MDKFHAMREHSKWLSSVFWVPRADMRLRTLELLLNGWLIKRCQFQADAKSNLAILHDRNDMNDLFRQEQNI